MILEVQKTQQADTTEGESGEDSRDQTQPTVIEEIFVFLSENEKIIFRSQQIEEPDLSQVEKIEIARDIYANNRHTFISRFGQYLERVHIDAFISSNRRSVYRDDECYDEVQLMLTNLLRKLTTRQTDVKNRRYAAMQQLIKDGEYFSEREMMKREPDLYQELIGQYLSEAEKKQRDAYDVKNSKLSDVMMHMHEQEELATTLKEADERIKSDAAAAAAAVEDDCSNQSAISSQQNKHISKHNSVEEFESDDDDDDNAVCGHEKVAIDVPTNCRQQWGNFDNELVACSTSQADCKTVRAANSSTQQDQQVIAATTTTTAQTKTKSRSANVVKYITAGERDLFRQEFYDYMQQQFLAGNDADFDYAAVDDNAELDDLNLVQQNQDREEEYFNESDTDDGMGIERRANIDDSDEDDEKEDESEDELDIFMSHLKQHPSLQQKQL